MSPKRCILLLAVCAALLWALPASAASKKKTADPAELYVSVTACEDGAAMPSASVAWYTGLDGKYLLLPGAADLDELRVWFSGTGETLTVNGQTLRSGDRLTGVADGTVLEITMGDTTTQVQVEVGSELASLFVTTESGSMATVHKDKDNKEAGTLFFLNPDGTTGYDGGMEHIKMRGNTAPSLDKKNYGIKLENGANLLGMGKAKRWVLLGSYRDHSMLRNQIVYSMAAYAGLRYTPEQAQVDVYMNHEYYGTYLLCEKIEINESRVDIADLDAANKAVNDQPLDSYKVTGNKGRAKNNQYKAYALENDPEDITGGYIIEYENYRVRYGYVACAYSTAKGKIIVLKDPEIVSVAEMEYISSFIQGYENAIFAKDGIDKATGKRYDEFVDFDSLVTKYMLEEISMNEDGNGSSQYYFKPSDSESTVAFAGPCWDYDSTFACFSPSTSRTRHLQTDILQLVTVNSSDYWWAQLYSKDEFKEGVYAKWASTYRTAMQILLGEAEDPTGTLLSVDAYAGAIAQSAEMNFIRWPISKSGSPRNTKRTGQTWEANLTFLKKIISERYTFLEKKWGKE